MELLTIDEVGKILRISRQAVSRAIADDRIKAAKIGGRYRISKTWLENYISDGGDINESGARNQKQSINDTSY